MDEKLLVSGLEDLRQEDGVEIEKKIPLVLEGIAEEDHPHLDEVLEGEDIQEVDLVLEKEVLIEDHVLLQEIEKGNAQKNGTKNQAKRKKRHQHLPQKSVILPQKSVILLKKNLQRIHNHLKDLLTQPVTRFFTFLFKQ